MQRTNKFYILYAIEQSLYEEDQLDRKVIYECEDIETASYIVAKIKS